MSSQANPPPIPTHPFRWCRIPGWTALAFIGFALPAMLAASHHETITLPPGFQKFVEKDTRALALEKADLNGDGLVDYLLVLERNPHPGEREDVGRILLILVAGRRNRLVVAKRSESAIRDDGCGGTLGDCFQYITAGPRTFTIHEYGGSAWRWGRWSTFRYSRIDHTWQLVEVREESFHVSDPQKVEKHRYRPPHDFGKIDIEDFDAMNYRSSGKR